MNDEPGKLTRYSVFSKDFQRKKGEFKELVRTKENKITVRIGQNRTHLDMGKRTDGEKKKKHRIGDAVVNRFYPL